MKIEKTKIKQISNLARISINEAEVRDLQIKLSNFLLWVEQLNLIDTSAVEPMTKVCDSELLQRNDEVLDDVNKSVVVENAPLSEGNYYVVPKVIQ
ncbi:MAG: Glutamyl-tRNA(Gln) amidotransferase subunit C [Hyphomicrobiaceae bacterium hypho_1]